MLILLFGRSIFQFKVQTTLTPQLSFIQDELKSQNGYFYSGVNKFR